MFQELRRQSYSAVTALGLLAVLGLPDLGGLLGVGEEPESTPPTAAQWQAMGKTHSPARTLRAGCRDYAYTYEVKPPGGTDWTLQTFLKGPKGRNLGSGVLTSNEDRRSGTSRFRICRSNTTYGTFTIRAKLAYKDWPEEYSGWLRNSTFTMRRP